MSSDDAFGYPAGLRELAAERGVKLGEEKLASLTAEELSLRSKQQGLAEALDAGALAPEHYLHDLNEVMEQYLSTARKLLGVADYARLFDGPSTDPQGLVDPDVFMREERLRSRAPTRAR